MPTPAYDPFKDETLGRLPPKTRVRIDWKRGARLLAGGEPADAVAAALGIGEDRLWRHFHKSLRFRFLFTQARERNRLTAQMQFEAAGRRAAVQRCGRIEEIDGDAWQWLARETGLTGDDAATGDNARSGTRPSDTGPSDTGPSDARAGREARLTAALKDAGRAPPNQALRERLRKERAKMDAVVAEFRARDRAAGILPPASTNAATGENRIGTNPDKTQISADKTQIGSDRAPVSADKTQTGADSMQVSADTQRSDVKPPESEPAGEVESAPDARVFRPHHYGSVIDLTDMHGNPLPGREHLLKG